MRGKAWVGPLFRVLMVFAAAFVISACQSPLLEQMQQRIVSDVTAHLAGPAPRVLQAFPADATTGISTSPLITVQFDIELDPTSIGEQAVRLSPKGSQNPLGGSSTYDASTKTLSFSPAERLVPDSLYVYMLDPALKSAQGALVASTTSTEFRTRYFHDDEIGLDLSYVSNDLFLNSASPIYIQAYAIPLPKPPTENDMAILSGMPITRPGKYRIPQNLLPRASAQIVMFLFHDIDGNYAPGADGASDGDSERIVKIGAPGNLVDPEKAIGEVILDNSGEYFVFSPSVILEIGNGYSVTYSDGSPFVPDGYESQDTPVSNARLLTQGITETARNLHALDDIDYFRFTPASTDKYSIRIGATAYDLRVEVYATDSAALNRTPLLASSSGSVERSLTIGNDVLSAGQTYYIRVDSPAAGLGPYSIAYQFVTVAADAAEADNELATAKPLAFGRANQVQRTFHEEASLDFDWFAIHLEGGKTYAVEVKEDTSGIGHSAAARGLKAKFRLEWQDGSSTNISYPLVEDGNTLYIGDPDTWWGVEGWPEGFDGAGIFYLRVQNDTPVKGEQRPTMHYTILLTWGPDAADSVDNPHLSGNQFDQLNEHGPNGIAGSGNAVRYAAQGEQGSRRTIYSVLQTENPTDDADWFRFQTRNNLNDYLIWTMPEPGTDGIIVEFEIYRAVADGNDFLPDLSAPVAEGQKWTGSQDEPARGVSIYPGAIYGAYTEYPTLAQSTFFVKVWRSTDPTNNPATGAYHLYFKAGADWLDDNIPDTIETVGGVGYGLDETPWIGQPNSTDLTERNKLADRDDWTGSGTPMLYRSIFARNYEKGSAKPLPGVEPGPDHDWLWAEVPAGITAVYLTLIASHENASGLPIKASIYKAPNTGAPDALTTIRARDSNTDDVITQAELVYVNEYNSQALYIDQNSHVIYQSIAVSGGDVLFVRIERDDANALPGDPLTGEYSIRFTY